MASLTYRGIVYQKNVSAPTRETVSDAPHTYRGTKYHYEAKKKKAVA
tara:strand:+ start:709 stop:849 length:141 start_codon:yes stop_codon:yes gene_type:complete